MASSKAAAAERYRPDEGTDLLPGIRQVDLSERESPISGYASVSMRDIVMEPGAEIPAHQMENDMVCHIGENGVYSCAVGTGEGAVNATDRVAIMRITDLHRA